MASSMGLIDVRISIFKLLKLSYFISDFDRVCGRLYGLTRACISDSHAYKFAVPLKGPNFRVLSLMRCTCIKVYRQSAEAWISFQICVASPES